LRLDEYFYAEAAGLHFSGLADESRDFSRGTAVAFYDAEFCGANG
jgi:hypothetical protein